MLPPWLRDLDTLKQLREAAVKAMETRYSGPQVIEVHYKEGKPKTRKFVATTVSTVLLPDEPSIRLADKAS